jgi:tRNA (guanine37-N1)-methyltransferase
MRVDVVTIFPEYLRPLELSLIGKARVAGLLDVVVHDLRDFTHDRHRTVDDTPAGGGAGMVMKPEPWGEALDHVVGSGTSADPSADPPADPLADPPTLIVPSPSGARFTQAMAHRLAELPRLVFACGRYEGIDERVLDDAAARMPVLPISLGDYVLNGGEVAVLVIVEAVARLLPGVVGNADSLVEESHEGGLLEYPVYTKPPQWRGREVPEVLISGHHAQVRRWRREQRLIRTARRRPDLVAALDPAVLDGADLAVLAAEGWTASSQGWVRGPLDEVPMPSAEAPPTPC